MPGGMGGMPSNHLRQVSYRGRFDDGVESAAPPPTTTSGATWIAPINTPWEQEADTNFRVRGLIEHTGFGGFGTPFGLRYSFNDAPFVAIDAETGPIRVISTVHYVHHSDSTDFVGRVGTGVWADTTNECNVGTGPTGSDVFTGPMTFTGDLTDEIETEWCLQISGSEVNRGDTFELQWTQRSDNFQNGYSESPYIVVPREVLSFDGVEGRVVVDNYRGVASSGIPFPHNDDRSLAFWIQTTQSGLATVCYWGDDLTGTINDGEQNRIRLIKDRLEIFGRGSYRRTDSVINDGRRHHVVFTYTSTGATLGHEDFGVANVYVDNVLDNGANRTGGVRNIEYRGEDTTKVRVDTPSEHIVVLGARPVGSGVTTASGHFTEYFEGTLTDFSIYHDVLAEDTRTSLYN
ncbi:hypothetical protein LCGC14_2767080, partial [marine sediment metagenome]